MGNSSAKESRDPPPYSRYAGRSRSSQQSPTSPDAPYSPDSPQIIYTSRHGRGSRSELSTLFGISSSQERDQLTAEVRRETKAEREARKLEKERRNREIERERSMREESVDGGYLVTQGVYTGIEDYSKPVVRQLMIERRLAPFWRGLNDHSDSWTEHQLVAAARGKPIPAADEVPESPEEPFPNEGIPKGGAENTGNNLSVPIPGKQSGSSTAQAHSPIQQNFSVPNSASPMSGSALLRGRAKTLASLTTSSKNVSQTELAPREKQLPSEPQVNGQPLEAFLYKDASECPICFLYYPPYLNRTRCCDQPICTECFVQIKRPDPHPPEHADPSQPPQPAQTSQPSPDSEEGPQSTEGLLISEPAACPYCVQPEFGVTFDSLPFKRGLTFASPAGVGGDRLTPPMSTSSSSTSLPQASQAGEGRTGRKRGTSLSATSSQVITTDRVRPDWATKLASARAHAARRSAAATALHTAAYMMNGRGGSSDRNIFGRRTLLRRGGENSSGDPSAQMHMINMMNERYAQREQETQQAEGRGEDDAPSIQGPPRHSSRRNRVEDLEEMMMMEAIRLSLASEEDRRRKEKKSADKEAKKKQKEDKKADKAARKQGGLYPPSRNQSGNTLDSPSSASLNIEPSSGGKGKSVAKDTSPDGEPSSAGDYLDVPRSADSQSEAAQQHLERSRAQILPSSSFSDSALPSPSPYRPSHLRNLSNASSSASSINDLSGTADNAIPRTPNQEDDASANATPGAGTDTEPMFNFRSLTAMVRDDERDGLVSPMVEHSAAVSATGSRTNLTDGSDLNAAVEAAADKVVNTETSTGKSPEEHATLGHDGSPAIVERTEDTGKGEMSKEPEAIGPSTHGQNLGKAHELAIETTGEAREQGSV